MTVLCTTMIAAAAATSTSVSWFQAIVLALLQGVSELFPVSSLGHTVILPSLLKWNINQQADNFLPFVVTLHLGTGIALVIYFFEDWKAVVAPMWRSVQRGSLSSDPEERLGWLLAVGTLPAAVIGVYFEKTVKTLFADARVAAIFLIVNGFIMVLGERLRLRAQLEDAQAGATSTRAVAAQDARVITKLGWLQAFWVGAAQTLALLPGISRSGVTMVAGLANGLKHETAARFSFLLATPIILAAGVVEVPTLFDPHNQDLLAKALVGGLLAGIAAYLSVRFLMRYFETNRLAPFAYYCWAAGILSLIVLTAR